MADKYGAISLPVEIPPNTGFPPVQAPGDILLGIVADFVKKVMEFHCNDIWASLSPNIPLVKRVVLNSPELDFNEGWLPALYVYRPGRETREIIETFEQIADDYRFQKGRLTLRWIMNPSSQENQRIRDQMIDPIRKALDAAIHLGRHKSWIHPDDVQEPPPYLDPKAPEWGSSLCNWSGAAVIEMDHAGPGQYQHKMKPPAPARFYDELKMSFFVEERNEQDLNLVGEPNQTTKATYESPDQGTGLGPFILGEAIYD